MATLFELHTLFFDEPLRNKIQAGLMVIGYEILTGLDTQPPYSQEAAAIAARREWAGYMVQNADNASDTAILNAIRTAADGLAVVYV